MMKSFEVITPSRKARVEIIPLIDVVFFLLATFVLFTLSLNRIVSLTAVLPQSVPGSDIVNDTTVYIQSIGPDLVSWKEGRFGALEQMSFKELNPRLTEYKTRVALPRVAVSGNSTVKLGAVTQLLDEVRKVKFDQVCMETAPTE